MGALHSVIGTRTNDYCGPLTQCPVSKKHKVSLFKPKDSIFSRNWLCPGSKPGFSRDVQGPVRHSRSKKVQGSVGLKGRLSEKMGNCLGIRLSFDGVKGAAAKSFKFLWREKCILDGREKEKLVIQIDDNDELEKERIIVLDDSSVEEIGIIGVSRSEWREGLKGVYYSRDEEKDFQSLDDVENMMEVMLLDNELGSFGGPAHKNLYDLTKWGDGKLSELDMEIEYKKKKEQVQKDMVEECFVPLTYEEEALVARALSNFNWTEVLVSHENSNIDITREKMQCLRPGGWLNDEVINLYLALLKEREKREPEKFLRCHFFNTFFYKKARYYVDEVNNKCGKEIDVSSWEGEFIANLPEQKNGFDCGMFMIKYADFYSRDIGLCFDQRRMPYFRLRTAKEILKQRAE